MGTTASHPFSNPAGMPAGGSPSWDADYLRWARDLCERANAKWLDIWMDRNTGEIPEEVGEIVNPWKMTNHLYKYCFGGGLPDGRWPVWRFKIRQVAVQFFYRRDEFRDEARAYLARLAHDFRTENPHLGER